MENIEITIATPEDAASIRQIQHDTWIDTYPNEKLGITVEAIKERVAKTVSPETIESLKKSLALDSQRTWVAKDKDKVVGYCTVEKEAEINKLGAIYILPDYQGRSIGKRLIEPALEWIGNSKDISVEVASYNEKAIRFYEKYGFVKNGITADSKGIPTIFLTKEKL